MYLLHLEAGATASDVLVADSIVKEGAGAATGAGAARRLSDGGLQLPRGLLHPLLQAAQVRLAYTRIRNINCAVHKNRITEASTLVVDKDQED